MGSGFKNENEILTRLHSSKMRTARLLTISPSMLCSVGVPGPGWGGGLPGLGGAWSLGGACSRGPAQGWGGIPACTGADPPPWTEILDTRF